MGQIKNNRTRHKHLCDGQTRYTVRKLDKVIDKVVHVLFKRLNDVPKEAVIAERYADQISECQMNLTRARANLGAHTAEVKEYEAEVIKVIRGESKLSSDLLSKIHEEAKARMEEAEKIVRGLESKLENSEKMRDRLAEQYDYISGWAELYDTCDLAAKKMIVSRMMKEVRVKRDYEIEIDLTASCEALGISLDKPIVFKESA